MLFKGNLVVKLPRQRVAELIASGEGAPFYSGNGGAMKKWVALEPALEERWLPIAQDAREFVEATSLAEVHKSD